ncbi:MAG: zinc-binding dehydrogenase [Acidimicrobiales bacterium]
MIRKGEQWGEPVELTGDEPRAADDAALAALVSREPCPSLVVITGGDLHHSLGGRPSAAVETPMALPIDVLDVSFDGATRVAVAHVVARGDGWTGPFAVAMNATHLGDWNLGPKAHPNDGLVDITSGRLGLRDRLAARRRTARHARATPGPAHRARRRHRLALRAATLDLARRCAVGSRPLRLDPGPSRPQRRRSRLTANDAAAAPLPSTPMRSWYLSSSPGEYEWGEVPTPEPGPHEVRVRVVASGVNHIDHWQTRGLPKPKHFPHVPGSDGAGVVEAIGPDVDRWAVGDEVVVNSAQTSADAIARLGIDSVFDPSLQLMGEHRWGCHGELVVIPDHGIEPRPAGRTWEECAAYPVALTTAWRMLRRARLQPGETVLVTGIGGGVATAAQVLAQHLGARVFTTSRDAAKRARSIELGAEDSFDSHEAYPVKVDVVVDSIGPATWNQTVAALKPGGRLATCGGTSGSDVQLSLPRLFFKQHEIVGSTLGSAEEFAFVTKLMAEGLPVVVDQVLPWAEYPEAVERIRRADQLGKIVIRHE